jgi:hypothetical protein
MKKNLLTSFIAFAVILIGGNANAEQSNEREFKSEKSYNSHFYSGRYNKIDQDDYRGSTLYRRPNVVYNEPYYEKQYSDKDDYRYSYYYDKDKNRKKYEGKNNSKYKGSNKRSLSRDKR